MTYVRMCMLHPGLRAGEARRGERQAMRDKPTRCEQMALPKLSRGVLRLCIRMGVVVGVVSLPRLHVLRAPLHWLPTATGHEQGDMAVASHLLIMARQRYGA